MGISRELVKKGIFDKAVAASLENEAKNSGKTEEELILEKGLANEDFLFRTKSDLTNFPLKKISSDDVSPKILGLIPEDSARHYKMVPLGAERNKVEIGMVYPEDAMAREALEFLSRQGVFSYKVFLITLADFNSLLKKYGSLKKEVAGALVELESELEKDESPRGQMPSAEFERMVEEAPISKVVAVILKHAVEGKASDIHIEPTRDKLRIRFRLTGVLYPSILLPLKIHSAVVARVKIISNLKIDETRIPQDGRFTARIGNRDIDFRVSTFPTILGEKIAIRILDPSHRVTDFLNLGISGRNFEAIERAINKPYGMILVTGPTGCGKTTTLYAVMGYLNKEGVNIVTLEDPVEYFMEGINQSQIKPEIGYEFSTGLRQILRQDPNIIMVGEIRDEETASLAVQSALTGHIVLSTLHTNSAIGVIPRLIDMGVKPFLISPTMSIAVAQRLVRKLCDDCKKKIRPNKEAETMILKEISDFPAIIKKNVVIPNPMHIYEPGSCARCGGSGFSERVGVFEILEMTHDLSELILKEPSESKIMQEAKKQGMVTMKQDGILKVLEGITTLEEVLRVAEEK